MTRGTLVLTCVFVISQLALAEKTEVPPKPREQLKQYIAELQSKPDDGALREKIIELARTIKPKPAVPEEARRHMSRGKAAFEDAKEAKDLAAAITEFKEASIAAPWWSDAYFTLGLAQEKAKDYAGAKQSLSLYLLAAPDASDAKDVKSRIYELEYRQEKAAKEAASPEGRAVRQREKDAELIRSLDGTRYINKHDERGFKGRLLYTDIRTFDVRGNEIVQGREMRDSQRSGWKELGRFPLKGRQFVIPKGSACNGGFNCDAHGAISNDGQTINVELQGLRAECPRDGDNVCDGAITYFPVIETYNKQH